MLRVIINGRQRLYDEARSVLAAIRQEHISLPTLCHDDRLTPAGACRLCLVEIKGQSRPVAACTTQLVEGMEIKTHSSQLEQLRRTQLRLLARHYPSGGATASGRPDFLHWIETYGLADQLAGASDPEKVDDSHPCIHVDMSRCITCYRCVRICDEVAGRNVWQAWNRGDRTEIRPALGVSLADSDCVSCGACVDTCPSGALLDKIGASHHAARREVRTVCPYCGVGCEMLVGCSDEKISGVRPVADAAVNKGHLCVKGRYGWQFVHAADRITQPMIRTDDGWAAVSWDEAVSFVASRLKEIVADDGPDAVGVLGSSRATNEENYLAQKFARVVIGTNNVDCCARVCHAPTAAGMKLMLGTGAATNSFDDIERAHAILVCGANPTENHPVVGDRIRQAARRGVPLVVIDPRRIDLAEDAAVHLQLRPGTNVPLLNAMANVLVEEKLYDQAVVPRAIEQWEDFRRFIHTQTPEAAAGICGVDAALIREAAHVYASNRPAMCFHGLGVTEHTQGTEAVMCLVNLAVLTGNIGRPGAGVNPLRGQNNVQGAAHMGCDPGVLPGGASLADDRQRFEAAWDAPLSRSAGLNLMQMIDAARRGRLSALWVMGYDIALTNPHGVSTLEALRALRLVIVQDLFLTETAQAAATVFLPACSSFEKDGTFMNSERRIQRIRRVIEPVGQSLPDWEIICRVARAMGCGERFDYGDLRQIWDEVRSVWPAGEGITYDRLEGHGLQWPCATAVDPGAPYLHGGLLAEGRRIKLRHVAFTPSPEAVTAEFPLLLNTGRALYQFNAGTMTSRSRCQRFQPTDVLKLSPYDADQLHIDDGERVRLISRFGEITITAQRCDALRRGELFTTFQSPELFVNRVTSPFRDNFTHTPEYKVTAVRIQKLSHAERRTTDIR